MAANVNAAKMNEEEEVFDGALKRVLAGESMDLTPQLDSIFRLKARQIRLHAEQIYAAKEMGASQGEGEGEAEAQKQSATVEGDELHNALTNHAIVRALLQKAVNNSQVQRAVYESLAHIHEDEEVGAFPEKGQLLGHYSMNLEASKSLAAVLARNLQLEKMKVSKQQKYRKLLDNLRQKWEALEQMKGPPGQEMTKECKDVEERVEARTHKLQVLVSMIQGLISGSGFEWAADEFYLKAMVTCDAAITPTEERELEEIMQDLTDVMEGHQKDRQKAQKERQKITSYYTSTPARKERD